MRAIILITGKISSLLAIAGIVCYYLGFNNVTIGIGIFLLADSILQILFGYQNSLVTEIVAIIVGVIIAGTAKITLWSTMAVALCFESVLLTAFGLLRLIRLFSSLGGEKRKCPSCGAKLKDDYIFCNKCGYDMKENHLTTMEKKIQTDISEKTTESVRAISSDTIDTMRKWKSLLDDGIVTEEEFDSVKKKILNL